VGGFLKVGAIAAARATDDDDVARHQGGVSRGHVLGQVGGLYGGIVGIDVTGGGPGAGGDGGPGAD